MKFHDLLCTSGSMFQPPVRPFIQPIRLFPPCCEFQPRRMNRWCEMSFRSAELMGASHWDDFRGDFSCYHNNYDNVHLPYESLCWNERIWLLWGNCWAILHPFFPCILKQRNQMKHCTSCLIYRNLRRFLMQTLGKYKVSSKISALFEWLCNFYLVSYTEVN